MEYGNFNRKDREYVIYDPRTPTPWINYLGNGNFGGIISQTGGGYCFDRDPRYKRILRYRYNSIPVDQPGRYIYIRDDDRGNFWSATWQPVKENYQQFRCRHGLGYTGIEQVANKISSSLLYFIPLDDKMEIWWLKIKNHDQTKRKLSLFTYAEFSFFDAVADQQNLDWTQQIQQGSFTNNTIFWNEFSRQTADTFFTSNLPPVSFTTSRENFVGKYRDLGNPQMVELGRCDNYEADRGNGAGVLHHQLILQPGEEKWIGYYLGTTQERDHVQEVIQNYKQRAEIEKEVHKLRKYWDYYLEYYQVKTPDQDMNLMLNTWHPYQCRTTFNWSRFVSLYQLGIKRGMGFRDSAQDILGVVHALPDKCRQLIIKLLGCQHAEGNSYHLFYPLTGEGSKGEAGKEDLDWYSDDHLWIIPAVTSYIKETGDKELLQEEVVYSDQKEKGTVLEHLQQAIEFTENHRGPHGLPLIGYADWNDTLNLERGGMKAESVWTGMFYCYVLREMTGLMEFIGRENEAQKYHQIYKNQQKVINEQGWNGYWYLRAFTEDGKALGARKAEQGKIFLNPQSWAVMSGVAGENRRQQILQAVEKHLSTAQGVELLTPPFTAFDNNIGGLTTYPPGAKENGGIFLHSNPWLIIAETLNNNCRRANKYYWQTLPVKKNKDADIYEVEPYVYCQNILGSYHSQFGKGRNSWLTGTAAWMYRAATQYILGIRPGYRGIKIEPCVPQNWEGYKVHRKIRGKKLNIDFIKASKRVIVINGKTIAKKDFIQYQQLVPELNNIQVYYN